VLGSAASGDAVGGDLCHDRRMRPTVLIVDDHEAFRESASALLEAGGFTVVGEAADGGAAVAEAERLRPQVVLLDIHLPDLDGFAVAERLTAMASPPHVVLISSRDAATYGARLAAAPARGFISKRELSGPTLAELVG
jgi:DNA-binding NarL/FixJ family response regulator